jgi:outer membrane protein
VLCSLLAVTLLALAAPTFAWAAPGEAQVNQAAATGQQSTIKRLSLNECIDIALTNNRLRKISKVSVDVAEAQYRQALSGYWPQLTLTATGTRMENNPLFVFPGQPLPLGDAAGPFAEAIANTQLAKMGVSPSTPGYNTMLAATTSQVMQGLQNTNIAEQRVKLMDRDNLSTTLELIYPLYTGGRRSTATDMARAGVQIAKEASRRTDLQVITDVRRYYHGAILAKDTLDMGEDALEKFQVTLELTENLYKNGAGKVKKTDYLRALLTAHSMRAAVESFKSNEILARSALGNALGLDWHTEVAPADSEIPVESYGEDFEKVVTDAQGLNPLLSQVRLAVGVAEARVREAKSGHLPLVVLFGQLNRIDNAYNAGMVPDENKRNWLIGARLELPLFKGFRTVNEEKEATARVQKIREESLLLSEGLALQVKDAFLQVGRSLAQVKATKSALEAAIQNEDLNTRAYREELVDTKDVIEAQMIQFFVHGQYLKALYDHVTSRNDLEFLVGKNLIEGHGKK